MRSYASCRALFGANAKALLDRILSIQDERVDNLVDLNRILREKEGADSWPMEIERRGERFSRTLSL